jgi:outer membrane lipoprotein-sorting protein
MKFFILSSAMAVLGTAFLPQTDLPGVVKSHVSILQEAKSLKAEFTVTKLSGGLEKGTLVYSKTGMYKIDMPSKLIESDGKMVWTFNKQANSYTEMPASLAPTKEFNVWAWAAFFSTDALKGTKDYVVKGNRTIKGIPVTEYLAKMANDKAFSLFMDLKTGVARGASNSEVVIMAQGDIVLGKEAMDIKDFTFMPPAGAKKEEKPAESSITYSQVETILKANCLPCHSSGNRKAGLSVDSYEGVMAKIVAGNAMNSGLFRSIAGPRATMPQGKAPLAKTDLDIIEGWIKAGAKNQ